MTNICQKLKSNKNEEIVDHREHLNNRTEAIAYSASSFKKKFFVLALSFCLFLPSWLNFEIEVLERKQTQKRVYVAINTEHRVKFARSLPKKKWFWPEDSFYHIGLVLIENAGMFGWSTGIFRDNNAPISSSQCGALDRLKITGAVPSGWR